MKNTKKILSENKMLTRMNITLDLALDNIQMEILEEMREKQ